MEWIRANNNDQLIPPIMNLCMDFLSKPDNLETEGIFRKSGHLGQIKELMARINNGERILFNDIGDVHIAAVILKTFFKELEEPLLTFALFDSICQVEKCTKEERVSVIKNILEQLPDHNYVVLKHLVEFLSLVSQSTDSIKKTYVLNEFLTADRYLRHNDMSLRSMFENGQIAAIEGKCCRFRYSSKCLKTHCDANN